MRERNTIYEAHQPIDNPSFIRCFDSEREVMRFLENNGGGWYKNILHRFECKIKPNKGGLGRCGK